MCSNITRSDTGDDLSVTEAPQENHVPPVVYLHNVNDNHSRDVVLNEITENYGPWMLV